MDLQKIMVIGREIPQQLRVAFRKAVLTVIHIADGKTALLLAQREKFDAAILLSTGEEMDLAETVFNLRDIDKSIELLIVYDQAGARNSAVPTTMLASSVPNAATLSTSELTRHLKSLHRQS